MRQAGQPLAKWLTEHDVRLARVRADLAMVGRSFEAHVAQSVLAGAAGFVLPLLVVGLLSFVVDYSATVPLVVALVGAVVGLLLPTLQAAEPRDRPPPRLRPRARVVPRPGGDEPLGRPRCARGPAVGVLDQARCGRCCASATRSSGPGCWA
ncbi:hypothetical protein GCM10025868_35320 [Angustibacter aerolatus]|uniref:ABC transmembrane type-1 domain-containing protein n=1 Tax=Angustibacter aerolatus TaxID=1162965 RepID=A0ABQ6JKH2_9ACTN|nr:hypothetical protein GCM10025868_35320 [Angustibacter aerolatus]